MPTVTSTATPYKGEISFEERKEQLEKAEEARQKELKKSPYSNFFQVNKQNNKFLVQVSKENPSALTVFLFLAEKMDRYNAVIISSQTMAELIGVSRATITRSVKYLREHGLIYVFRSGLSNVYVLNDSLVWNSYGTNRKYCEFPSNVILSFEEQSEEYKAKQKKLTFVEAVEKE